ncbi:MAG: DUF6622 family protein [Xanthobacteraceae bacterium]
MEILSQSFSHTPLWVYALFVFLIWRGLRSLRPSEVTLGSLAAIPAIFMTVGVAMLALRFGFTLSVFGPWLMALAAGVGTGWLLLRRAEIAVDRSRGVLYRAVDYTVLPLILGSFVVKYAFGAVNVVNPQLSHQPSFGALEGAVYGFFAGIFVGKFANYTMRYLRTSSTNLTDVDENMSRSSAT